ncbi:MAG TPA: phenylalanine--tRNA ligase subunit beta [Patescibacteria group bacterium]|nr:phenylalanine--tRNA ligase subunit beta [Patescibacteria group bacterium]
MKISLNWLKDLVNIPSSLTPEKMAARLILSTTEIEGIEKSGEILDKILIGEVLECEKHPNADRLSVTKVDIGSGKKLNIVCGAPNVARGQKVAVALSGVTLPNGLTLEKREVRGIMSEGMICAEDELGLSKSHEGIMVLPPGAKTGKNLSTVIKAQDIVFEIDNKSITNRPDLWGHLGMAREVAALFGGKLKDFKFKNLSGVKKKEVLKVKVENKKLCPRYIGAVVENIKIAPSPEWLRLRLESVGVRSINNIVDITNYVMLELGQPMHAFSFDKIINPKSEIRNKSKIQNAKQIIMRTAGKDEKIITIDGVERKLDNSMLVIADEEKPIALAGIMGGANTEIDNDTETIILESANFDFVNVRKTSMALGLRTESSMRFEKGLDPNLAELAMKKALHLIAEMIPQARLVNKIIDIKNFKLNQGPIKLGIEYLNKKIGYEIPLPKIINILKSLGFAVKKTGANLVVKIPTWRATKDISIADDLVEEIARIYGYDNLEPKMPEVLMVPPEVNRARMVERRVKNVLANSFGMSEVHNYSFADEKILAKAGFDPNNHLQLKNSIAKNLSHLRQSLIPNLILNISHNQHFFDKIKMFELGMVFSKETGKLPKDAKAKEFLPKQENHLVGLVLDKNNGTPFYSVRDIVAEVLEVSGIKAEFIIKKDAIPGLINSERLLEVKVDKETIGVITELNQKIQNNFGIKSRIGIFEFNFEKLVQYGNENRAYAPIPKYPSIELDLSIIVPRKVLWQEILDAISGVTANIVKEVRLFDVYEGKGIEEGKKSLAFRIVYSSEEKTLTLDEVKKKEEEILRKLEQSFGAKLRVK